MNREQTVRYLANVYHVAASDGAVGRDEERVFEEIARDLRAVYTDRKQAQQLGAAEGIQSDVGDRWSTRIKNLEDMMYAAYCNGRLDAGEKTAVVTYAKTLGIDQKQLNLIKQEAKQRCEAARR